MIAQIYWLTDLVTLKYLFSSALFIQFFFSKNKNCVYFHHCNCIFTKILASRFWYLCSLASYRQCVLFFFLTWEYFGAYFYLLSSLFPLGPHFFGWSQWTNEISTVDTKAKCRHLKKFTSKGTLRMCLSNFIDWRYIQSCWYFRPSFVNCWLSNLLSLVQRHIALVSL
jgi:hypothetical protein